MKEYVPCLDDPEFFINKKNDFDDSRPYLVRTPINWCQMRSNYEWVELFNKNEDTPRQGWKIHISSILKESHKMLKIVSDVCFKEKVSFKFLSSEKNFLNRNSKLMNRGYSGKFITCYPKESILKSFLDTLEKKLKKYNGPYILSDKKWKQAPIYLRYGVFRPTQKNENYSKNIEMLTINGKDIKDNRSPNFVVPEGLKKPTFLKNWLNNSDSEDDNDTLPFDISNAIRFTNCGGVYSGKFNEKKAIIKEGRPFTGIDNNGLYAPDKIRIESQALKKLSFIKEVPQNYWFGKLWEDSFLVSEKIEGVPLNRWVSHNFPIYNKYKKDYLKKITTIIKKLITIVKKAHEKNVFHQDIHLGNIIIKSDNHFSLIDWGEAKFDNHKTRQYIAAPGFRYWGEGTPSEIDWYGIYQIAHFMFCPIIVQSDLTSGYSKQTLRAGKNIFEKLNYSNTDIKNYIEIINNLEKKFEFKKVYKSIKPYLGNPRISSYNELGKLLLTGIKDVRDKWLTHNRHRYFPVHYYGIDKQDGISFSDISIIWALKKLLNSLDVKNINLKNILNNINNMEKSIIENKVRQLNMKNKKEFGLFDGLSGTLWILYELGYKKLSKKYFNYFFDKMLNQNNGYNLYSGLSGILLVGIIFDKKNILTYKNSEILKNKLNKFALNYNNNPENYIMTGKDPNSSNNPYKQNGGLYYGHAGIGWMFAQAYKLYKKEIFKNSLNISINSELKGFELDQIGTLQYSQGQRLLPYLAIGSAGIGILISEYKNYIYNFNYKKLKKLYDATNSNLCVFPGISNGLAGLKISQKVMNNILSITTSKKIDMSMINDIKKYLIKTKNGVCIAGDSGSRITTDIFSGSAGIALSISSLKDDSFNLLPKIY